MNYFYTKIQLTIVAAVWHIMWISAYTRMQYNNIPLNNGVYFTAFHHVHVS